MSTCKETQTIQFGPLPLHVDLTISIHAPARARLAGQSHYFTRPEEAVHKNLSLIPLPLLRSPLVFPISHATLGSDAEDGRNQFRLQSLEIHGIPNWCDTELRFDDVFLS